MLTGVLATVTVAGIAAIAFTSVDARAIGRTDPKRAAHYRLPWFNFSETYTDGQALGWHNGSAAASTAPAGGGDGGQVLRLLKEMKETAPAHVLLVGDEDTRNLSVAAVRLTTELPTVNKVLRFEVQVNNSGNAPIVILGRTSDNGSGLVLEFLRSSSPFRATTRAETGVWKQADR